MITLIEQARDFLESSKPGLFLLFCVWSWGIVWLSRVVPSIRYRTFKVENQLRASVIIPVVDEDPAILDEVLCRILAQQPDEVCVVINGPQNHDLERVCQKWGRRVDWEWTPIADKRNAEALGFRRTSREIVVLVDSDTFWTTDGDGTLRELLKPFSDPRVGGVTSHQLIRNVERNVVTRFAGWLEASRWLYSVPAQSTLGQVGVLPGRTIAFRREILIRCLDDFLTEPLRISDDRAQTMHSIAQGYRTVYQRSSLVETLAPETLPKLFRQQLRWSKGSQHNTLRWFGMMIRKCPYAAFQFCVEMLTPFLFLAVLFHGFRDAIAWLDGAPPVRSFSSAITYFPTVALGLALTALIRQFPLIQRKPTELFFTPVYALLACFVLIPTRILGLLMANLPIATSWGTRTGALTDQTSSRWITFATLYPVFLGTGLLIAAAISGIFFP